ncbi:MAG: 3'(2'),5'-bisphosphate nucleotidase CysQ [Pseudomonadota bacterium]
MTVSRLPVVDPCAAEDLKVLKTAVLEAGALALDWYQKGAEAWDKTPGHPVTEADIAVNDLLAQRLNMARPDYGWLSEETKDDPRDRDMTRVFVVDPIDGTRAFMRREPYFCVAAARLEGDKPVAAAIFNPATDELFEAAIGGGAKLNGEPIRAGDASQIKNCRMIGHANMFKHPAWPKAWPRMELNLPVPNAIAYRIALVASGRWHGAIALSSKSDWDLAAATLILEEAGGVCTDHCARPFSFNGKNPAQRSVVAAGAALHPLLIDRVHHVKLPDPCAE